MTQQWTPTNEALPEVGEVVQGLLRNDHNGHCCEHELVRVEEDDCLWRTADDHSEISYSWTVIAWREKSDCCQADSSS